ncbi:MAG: hypothetical protein ABSC30_16985 [Acidimicrobiales bacterium]
MIAPNSATPESTGTTLRGAGVDVDVRRLGRVVVALCLMALAVLTVVLFAVGVHKNSQINRLRQHGVAIQVTVSGCLGLLGGSGSNPAGYACRGTFTLDGHRYNESIPGNALRRPGTKVRAVAVSGNPPLLSTAHAVATERASASVFIVPAILLVVLALLVGVLVLRQKKLRRETPPDPSGTAQ